MSKKLIETDPWLEPYSDALARRRAHIVASTKRLLDGKSIKEFSLGHLYFGLHQTDNGWVLREWAPHATKIYLVGDHSDWQDDDSYTFEKTGDIWQLCVPKSTLVHGSGYKLHVYWNGGDAYRIPAYARYVVQDPTTHVFEAQVWSPSVPYAWQDDKFTYGDRTPYIYEAHIGMSSEDEKVASYSEFKDHILPRIKAAGYNTVQLMAIAEHPYYASFGYHVSNFFAPSSRFGTPDELKQLIDTAHAMGLAVTMDLIHSHAVKNEDEGLSRFDGTTSQYFHAGTRGEHSVWDSRVFDYGKPEVVHFLLSNCRYWLEEFHFDGYRFDGVTSMIYRDHGLGRSISSYEDYFSENVDEDALVYLTLANALIHESRLHAVTIAEDTSALPGLAAGLSEGGIGFDYRLNMGVPDLWIKLLKHERDEDWDLANLLHQLSSHRPEEKVISYAESHDQALVGDKTLLFRLADKELYDHMLKEDENLEIDRAVALRKMIYSLTFSTAAGGYLNFMGNEFGHPEWVDFAREGNNWSYKYARRQWSLVDNPKLKYDWLAAFDADMLQTANSPDRDIEYAYVHQSDHVLSFVRGDQLYVYNFSPTESYTDYGLPAPDGAYEVVLCSDAQRYGGYDRVDTTLTYVCEQTQIKLYLPTRTCVVLRLER